jgi:hypothetical protein
VESNELADGLRATGVSAQVVAASDKTHGSLNEDIGKLGDMPTAEIARFLGAILPQPAASASFSDVPTTHPHYAAITDLAARAVIAGYPDASFRPDGMVSRQQSAKMAVLAAGYPVSTSDVCPFTDVERSVLPALDPRAPMPRVEVAQVLSDLLLWLR